jgi:hypothetical protein
LEFAPQLCKPSRDPEGAVAASKVLSAPAKIAHERETKTADLRKPLDPRYEIGGDKSACLL